MDLSEKSEIDITESFNMVLISIDQFSNPDFTLSALKK